MWLGKPSEPVTSSAKIRLGLDYYLSRCGIPLCKQYQALIRKVCSFRQFTQTGYCYVQLEVDNAQLYCYIQLRKLHFKHFGLLKLRYRSPYSQICTMLCCHFCMRFKNVPLQYLLRASPVASKYKEEIVILLEFLHHSFLSHCFKYCFEENTCNLSY